MWQPCELLYTCYVQLRWNDGTTDGHSTVSDPSPQTVQAVSITHNTYTTATTTPVYRPLFQDNLVSQYQKGKTSLDLNEARDDGFLGWQRHQLDHMQTTCISLQTDNHTNTSSVTQFLQAGCSSWRPTNSVKAHSRSQNDNKTKELQETVIMQQ